MSQNSQTGSTCQILNKQKIPVTLAAEFLNMVLPAKGAEIKFSTEPPIFQE